MTLTCALWHRVLVAPHTLAWTEQSDRMVKKAASMSDDDTVPTEPQPGRYRHYKGGLYTVICLGRHSETEEWLVTYRAEANGTFWVRPLAMWNETVMHDGAMMPRFAAIGV